MTVPRMATPMTEPTWRMAEIRAEPDPLRSAVSDARVTFIADGITRPKPSPETATQASVNQVELVSVVNAPIASATAMTTVPGRDHGPRAGRRCPASRRNRRAPTAAGSR